MQRRTRASVPEVRSGIVTRLATRAGRADRTMLYLDGEAAGEIATVLLQADVLRVGHYLSSEMHAGLLARDEPYRARSRALKILTAGDRTVNDMRSRLEGAGFGTDAVATTIAWLCDLGYLDDERFVGRYLAEKTKAGWGERRLRAELSRKGVGRDLVEAAFAALAADDQGRIQEHEALMALVHRRFARQWGDDPVAAERRAAAFLARRGYDWDEVSRVLREFRARQEADPSEL